MKTNCIFGFTLHHTLSFLFFLLTYKGYITKNVLQAQHCPYNLQFLYQHNSEKVKSVMTASKFNIFLLQHNDLKLLKKITG